MKVRWRQQEVAFALLVFLIMLINHFIQREGDLVGDPYSRKQLYESIGVPYSYFRNSLLPFLLRFGSPVLLLLLINAWLIPSFMHHRFRWWIFSGTAILSWLVLVVSLGTQYYQYYYLQMERTGEPVFRMVARQYGITTGTIALMLYLLYLTFRESVINWLEQKKEVNAFRILVCNRITMVAFTYVLVLIFGITFGLFKSDGAAIGYIGILLPVIVTCFINLYLILPRQHEKGIPFYKNLAELSLAPFCMSILALLIYLAGSGHFLPSLIPAWFLIIMIIATPLSLLFYAQQRDKINSLLNLEKKLGKSTADLAFLRSQINPHFLFNTLNTLYGTALQENAARTASGIQRLGDMMRFLLHDNQRDSIPVSREVEYLQHYITLQSLRIVDSPGIRIETSISEANCGQHIAPMLLIPFVENAFKHGISLTKPSFIMIKFYCDEKGLYLDVVNSKHPRHDQTNEEGYSGVGMENVKQRLGLLYPGKHSLQIHQDDAAFTAHLSINTGQ